ncbi:ADP-ribosylation factor-like protein 9 isoform X1 [Engystomops pustulosus]|uniref:ADP-ribosylation factor-like protein 9 isoform X1 n=1 Tax=Engystomops pustulosus TaxID=76066 RepID=UPI003AFAB3D5
MSALRSVGLPAALLAATGGVALVTWRYLKAKKHGAAQEEVVSDASIIGEQYKEAKQVLHAGKHVSPVENEGSTNGSQGNEKNALSGASPACEEKKSAAAPVTSVIQEEKKSAAAPVTSVIEEEKKSAAAPVTSVIQEEKKSAAAPVTSVIEEEKKSAAAPVTSVIKEEKKSAAAPVTSVIKEEKKSAAAPVTSVIQGEKKSAAAPVTSVIKEEKKSAAAPVTSVIQEEKKSPAAPVTSVIQEEKKSAAAPVTSVIEEEKKSAAAPVTSVIKEEKKSAAAPVTSITQEQKITHGNKDANPNVAVNEEKCHNVESSALQEQCYRTSIQTTEEAHHSPVDKGISDTQHKEKHAPCKQVLVLGLDGSGKTSILNTVGANKGKIITTPTEGVNAMCISNGNSKMEFLEIGGSEQLRPYWKMYLSRAFAVVFVVDSADHGRLPLAKRHLHQLIQQDSVVPLLVLANKQDLQNAHHIPEIHDALALSEICENRKLFLIGTYVTKDGSEISSGIQDTKEFLAQLLLENSAEMK